MCVFKGGAGRGREDQGRGGNEEGREEGREIIGVMVRGRDREGRSREGWE